MKNIFYIELIYLILLGVLTSLSLPPYNYLDKPRSQDLKSFKEKVTKLFIHGFLHLLGFDHKKNKDYSKMLKEEKLIFKSVQSKII